MKILEHEDFEIILRRIMCITICLEAAYLSFGISANSSFSPRMAYFLHKDSFTTMFIKEITYLMIPLLFPILSLFFKPMYYLIEILHVIAGALVFLLIAHNGSFLLAIPASLIFSGRFLLYLLIMKKRNKYVNDSIIKKVRANIEGADGEKDKE